MYVCMREYMCVEREREEGSEKKKEGSLCSIKILSRIKEICSPQLNIFDVDGRRNRRDIFFEKVDVMVTA